VAESPPSRREWLAVAGLFLFALGLRLLNLQQIRANDPFFALPSVDPRMYHEWALRIAGGEWMGDAVFFLAPLYAYFLALVYAACGPSFLAAKLVQCAIGSLTCVLVWRPPACWSGDSRARSSIGASPCSRARWPPSTRC
jgi:hypothetical protein